MSIVALCIKTLCLIVLNSVCLCILLLFPGSVRAQEELTLRIMTYNVYGDSVKTAEFGDAKMLEIAKYIKENKIDIVALQEMTDWTNDTFYGEIARKIQGNDTVWLDKHLRDIEYPMYLYERPYVPHTSSGKNVTLSRFPINEKGISYFEISKKKRWALVTPLDTPFGEVTIINVHTYAGKVSKTPLCDQANVVNSKIRDDLGRNPKIIALGDWNLYLYIPSYCFGANWPARYDFFCVKSCKEESQNVDFALSPKESDFVLVDDWEDKSFKLSDHNPVISVLKLRNPPTNKMGDLDKDGDIDVFDYNILLGVFGQTGAPGFHSADIMVNGSIDIFDYNSLLRQLSK